MDAQLRSHIACLLTSYSLLTLKQDQMMHVVIIGQTQLLSKAGEYPSRAWPRPVLDVTADAYRVKDLCLLKCAL